MRYLSYELSFKQKKKNQQERERVKIKREHEWQINLMKADDQQSAD